MCECVPRPLCRVQEAIDTCARAKAENGESKVLACAHIDLWYLATCMLNSDNVRGSQVE